MLTPSDMILLICWKDEAAAFKYEDSMVELPKDARTRRVFHNLRNNREFLETRLAPYATSAAMGLMSGGWACFLRNLGAPNRGSSGQEIYWGGKGRPGLWRKLAKSTSGGPPISW